MDRFKLTQILFFSSLLLLSGCVVRTYQVTRDRVDQDLSDGNRGFLQGEAGEVGQRRTTRTTHVVEVELGSPVKFEKKGKAKLSEPAHFTESQDSQAWSKDEGMNTKKAGEKVAGQNYTVQKGDTLQKISKKFYGTTKNWKKIYNANTGVLKAPNKIYSGQKIIIPSEEMKEVPANLK